MGCGLGEGLGIPGELQQWAELEPSIPRSPLACLATGEGPAQGHSVTSCAFWLAAPRGAPGAQEGLEGVTMTCDSEVTEDSLECPGE